MVFLGFYRRDMRFERQDFDVLIATNKMGNDNWLNMLAHKLGFDDLKSYIRSYPDRFRSGRSINYYNDTMMYLWCSGVHDGERRIMINIMHSYIINLSKDLIDFDHMIGCYKDYLSRLIITPTIKEFTKYNKLKTKYSENDLWFCSDWREKT